MSVKVLTNIEVLDWCVCVCSHYRTFEEATILSRFLVYSSFSASSLNLPTPRELAINQLQLRRCQPSLCSGLWSSQLHTLLIWWRSNAPPPSPTFLAVFCRRTRPAGKSEAPTDRPSEGKTFSRCSSPGCQIQGRF